MFEKNAAAGRGGADKNENKLYRKIETVVVSMVDMSVILARG
jgi:hypothetical protein